MPALLILAALTAQMMPASAQVQAQSIALAVEHSRARQPIEKLLQAAFSF
ncbi:MAG TPA: hypothetical protein VMU05_18350 [Dongiaceae bacterium]|nr:hypothetical protein [Dongiaceae bacterium]